MWQAAILAEQYYGKHGDIMADTGNQLITPAEAARIVGVDPRTVSKWVRRSEVPGLGIEIAGRVFVRRSAIARLVDGEAEHGVESVHDAD